MSDLTVGKYRVLVRLVDGRSTSHYLAEDTTLRRRVALKVARHESETGDGSQPFQREAWRSASLNHPNIATVFDVGTDGEWDYIASEWIEGGTLQQRLKKGPLEVVKALNVAIGVARALVAYHEAWIVHRDVKPENIKLRSERGLDTLDFGVAALANGGEDIDPLKRPRGIAGSLHYLSPEQVRGEPIIDTRSDTYSLGVVLYEMLSGRAPFNGRATLDLLAAVVESDPEPLPASIPLSLRSIIDHALKKDIYERYQTAEELLQDLLELRLSIEFEERAKRSHQIN